jgi:PPM family protein phosphatase
MAVLSARRLALLLALAACRDPTPAPPPPQHADSASDTHGSSSRSPVPEGRTTKVVAHVVSDVGVVREHNEDRAYADPEGMFFLVADGMGGPGVGEVASAMAVAEMRRALEAARSQIRAFARQPSDETRQGLVTLLEGSVQKANQAVLERAGREIDKTMYTTLEALLVADGDAFVAHVGDSRTYHVRGESVVQVTTDHTRAEVAVMLGELTAEEARTSPLRTLLVYALGVQADVGVELSHIPLRHGDKVLLCSDGLHDYFPEKAELAEILAASPGEEGLRALVKLAKDRGGHDNITGILIEVVQGNLPSEEEPTRANLEGSRRKESPSTR